MFRLVFTALQMIICAFLTAALAKRLVCERVTFELLSAFFVCFSTLIGLAVSYGIQHSSK